MLVEPTSDQQRSTTTVFACIMTPVQCQTFAPASSIQHPPKGMLCRKANEEWIADARQHEPVLKSRIEWADRVQTPRRVNHREGISSAPLAGVLVTRAAHLTALLQQRPDPRVTRDDARHSTMIFPRNMPI